jgi:hypothetical protein
MAIRREQIWSSDTLWPPDDTEVSCLGTNLHQTTIRNLCSGLNQAASVGIEPGRSLPWTALSQMALLGCQRPDGSYFRTYPDVFVYLMQVDAQRGSLNIGIDGPPALIVEVLSESTFEVDIDHARGKGYSYARAGVPEYIALDPTGHYVAGVAAWRLAGDRYLAWAPGADGRWHSEQLPVVIGLEGVQAAIYLPGGRRMLTEGEVERALARKDADLAHRDADLAHRDAELGLKDAELARRDAEIDRLRRLLEDRS